jgi:hypothetical protein
VEAADTGQVEAQGPFELLRQHGDAVALALSVPHEDLAGVELHVLDPQSQAFQEAETGAVEEAGDQVMGAVHLRQHAASLFTVEDDGAPARLPRPDEVVQLRKGVSNTLR